MPASRTFFRSVLFLGAFIPFFFAAARAQSSSSEFPTPIGSKQITGKINARDLGDARLTSHYYAFEGAQGDIIIRVETANFDGDIDVFNAQGLRPIVKMSFIAGTSLTESMREIYLRKPEKMILRVEGRSTNDEAATYRIRFEGSFLASSASGGETPDAPQVKSETTGAVRVNSVGTIIETKREETQSLTSERPDSAVERRETVAAKTPEAPAENDSETENTATKKVTPPVRPPATRRSTGGRTTTRTGRRTAPPANSARTNTASKVETPDPLANVRLVVEMKEGEPVEHPINQVQRFSVERGILTIILKTGSILRLAVKDIARMSVE